MPLRRVTHRAQRRGKRVKLREAAFVLGHRPARLVRDCVPSQQQSTLQQSGAAVATGRLAALALAHAMAAVGLLRPFENPDMGPWSPDAQIFQLLLR